MGYIGDYMTTTIKTLLLLMGVVEPPAGLSDCGKQLHESAGHCSC